MRDLRQNSQQELYGRAEQELYGCAEGTLIQTQELYGRAEGTLIQTSTDAAQGGRLSYIQTENSLQLMVMLPAPIPMFADAPIELWVMI